MATDRTARTKAHQSVKQRLADSAVSGSKADKAIANYMMSALTTLPFETAASIATEVNVSEPTVGRFCRSIGYSSFKDLKNHLRADTENQPWLVSDRLKDLRERARLGEDQLARGLELEITALMAVYEAVQTPEWARVAKRLATVKRVFVAGFQTERGMAQIFVNQLQYLRDGVQLLDLAGGNFVEILGTQDDACLVLFEARRYSRLARSLAMEAQKHGKPVTLITDTFCDWGGEVSDEMFAIPTEFNMFWESTAQMASLANRLVNSVFLEMGPEAEERMQEIAALYSRFTGHIDGNTPLLDEYDP